jgi:hypothetical protein
VVLGQAVFAYGGTMHPGAGWYVPPSPSRAVRTTCLA